MSRHNEQDNYQIDPFDGDLVPLTEVPALLQSWQGKRIHYCSVYRWTQRGRRGRRLATLKIGGRLHTSLTAIKRFVQPDVASTTPDSGTLAQAISHPQPRRDRRRRREQAKIRVDEILASPRKID